jgi:pSer/pThr/pTyr-binding forkhead associated (FHA) protein
MNGTTVNGVAVRDRELEDGDEIGIGSTTIRFEAS